ncbi:MAG: hypothetical protein ACQEVA_01225 [Myxococcota bacterium]
MMIQYHTGLDDITAEDLDGFFVGWPSHPDPATHLHTLEGAWDVALAVDTDHLSWNETRVHVPSLDGPSRSGRR